MSSRLPVGATQPPIQWIPETLSPSIPLTSIEDKNTWIYTSTPLIRLHGVVFNYLTFNYVTHRGGL
jgi:hypothetical protein